MPVNVTDQILILEQDEGRLSQAIQGAVAAVLQKYRETYLSGLPVIPAAGEDIAVEDSLSNALKRRYRAQVRICQVLEHYQTQRHGEGFLRELEGYLRQPNGKGKVPGVNAAAVAGALAQVHSNFPSDDKFRFPAKMILLTLVATRALLLPMFSHNTFMPKNFGPEGNERFLDLLPRPTRELVLTLMPRPGAQTSIDWTQAAGSRADGLNRAGGDYLDWMPGKASPPVPSYAMSVGPATWQDIAEVSQEELEAVYELANAVPNANRAVVLYLNCLFFCRADDSAKGVFFTAVDSIPKYRIYTEEFKVFATRARGRRAGAKKYGAKTPRIKHLELAAKLRALIKAYVDGEINDEGFASKVGNVRDRSLILDFDQFPQAGPLPADCGLDWQAMMDHWKQAFGLFREYKRYEDERKALSELSSFFLYLGAYLPAWSLKHPSSGLAFPASIADFTGGHFVHRPASVPVPGVEDPPLTFVRFNEKLNEGNSQETIATRVRVVRDFFNEVIAGAELLGLPAGMTNPVRDSAVPSGGGRRYGSTKVPIPAPVVFLTLLYCYRILDCMDRVNAALLGPNNLVLSRHLTTFVTSREKTDGLRSLKDLKGFDLDTSATFDGAAINFDVVPASLFTPRAFPVKGRGTPMLLDTSPLEIIILMFETGLRGQSVQWLSTEFDQHVTAREVVGHGLYPLHVNTDKVKRSAWTAFVAGRVINLLRKRREFRRLLDGEIFEQEILYEDRERTKWPKFKAVFAVNAETGFPIDNRTYSELFKVIFHAQQRYIDELKLNFVASVPDETKEFGWQVDATPHSARKAAVMHHLTYLPAHYVGRYITGQTPEVVAYYAAMDPTSFDKVDNHQAAFQVVDATRRAIDTSRLPDVTEPHKPSSALARAFHENASRAMHDFGSMSTAILDDGSGSDVIIKGAFKLAFEPTHICPFGSTCPPERKKHGLVRRCNFCDFALRTVDHLPAIASELRNLIEEGKSIDARMGAAGARLSETQRAELQDRLRVIGEDYFALGIADYVLRQTLKRLKDQYRTNPEYFCFTPEIIVKNLEEAPFPRQDEGLKYVLGRLKEASTYFSLNDRIIKANIAKFARTFMRRSDSLHDLFVEDGHDGTAAEAYSFVHGFLSTHNMSLDQLVELLNRRVDTLAAPLTLALPESDVASLIANSNVGVTL